MGIDASYWIAFDCEEKTLNRIVDTLEMKREKHKPTYVRSNGIMETVFGQCLRDLRIRIEGKGENHEHEI